MLGPGSRLRSIEVGAGYVHHGTPKSSGSLGIERHNEYRGCTDMQRTEGYSSEEPMLIGTPGISGCQWLLV